MPSRFTNRPLGPNGFEQRDLAGTYAVAVGKVETNGKVGICHSGRVRSEESPYKRERLTSKTGPLGQVVKTSVQLSPPALRTITPGDKLPSSSTVLSW